MNEATIVFDGETIPVTIAEDGSRTVFYDGRIGYEKWQFNAALDLPLEVQMEVLEANWRHVMALSLLEQEAWYNEYFTGAVGGLSFYELFPYDGNEYLVEVNSDDQWAMVVGYRPLS